MGLSDVEILEHNVGGQFIKDMSSISFISYLARKINGVEINNTVRELQIAVSNPPMLSRLSNESKLHFCRLLLKLGLEL